MAIVQITGRSETQKAGPTREMRGPPPIDGWRMRPQSRLERPHHIDPALWERVTSIRENPETPFITTVGYLHRIAERLSGPERSPEAFPGGDSRGSSGLVGERVRALGRYQASNDAYLGTDLQPSFRPRSKDEFVQEMAQNYAALRMIYPKGNEELSANIYTELFAHSAGYQMDLFKANFIRLRPPIHALSQRSSEYQPGPDYVARVASELRSIAAPLRAIEFRHVLEGGDRRYYSHPDLEKALVMEQHAVVVVQESRSSVYSRDFYTSVVNRLQQVLDSGRPFAESQIYSSVMHELHHELSR